MSVRALKFNTSNPTEKTIGAIIFKLCDIDLGVWPKI